MKHLTTTMCSVLLALLAITGYSQNKQTGKPSQFAALPSSFQLTESQLGSFFAASKGQNISVGLTSNFTLAGPVTSNVSKYKNLRTIVVQLPAFNNSLFSLSKQTDEHNNTIYVGRILNPLYADAYELKRNPDGNYQLIKFDLDRILVTCNQ